MDEHEYDPKELCKHGRHPGAVCIPCAVDSVNTDDKTTIQKSCDPVHSPFHYTVGGYEAIDVIKAKLTPEEYRGYLKGSVMKYVMRANYKGHHDQDCEKMQWYGNELDSFLKSVKSVDK